MNASEYCRLTDDQAREHLESIRWSDGAFCPHCGSVNSKRLEGKSTRPGVHKCRDCRKQFTVTVGTIFERSHIKLQNWLYAFARMCASKKGISAKQLERELDITYKTAWFMCHRIRHAMRDATSSPLVGTVEVDETYVGGRPRPGSGIKHMRGRGTSKVPVLALVERDGRVRTKVVCDVTAHTLKGAIRENVHSSSLIMTDENTSYRGIGREFVGGHRTVCHGNASTPSPMEPTQTQSNHSFRSSSEASMARSIVSVSAIFRDTATSSRFDGITAR